MSHVSDYSICSTSSRWGQLRGDVLQLALKKGLPEQHITWLEVCGYKSLAAVCELDMKAMESHLQECHSVFNDEEKILIYGMYSSFPEKFKFRPGDIHEMQVFVNSCIAHLRMQEAKHQRAASMQGVKKRKIFTTPEILSPSNIVENSCVDIPIVNDLKAKLLTWCLRHTDVNLQQYKVDKDYKILVIKYITCRTEFDADAIDGLSVSIICCRCGTQIKARQRKNSFMISNITRHFEMCVSKVQIQLNSEHQPIQPLERVFKNEEQIGPSRSTEVVIELNPEQPFAVNSATGVCSYPDHTYVGHQGVLKSLNESVEMTDERMAI